MGLALPLFQERFVNDVEFEIRRHLDLNSQKQAIAAHESFTNQTYKFSPLILEKPSSDKVCTKTLKHLEKNLMETQ